MNRRTQNAKVIDHLSTGRPLTTIQAFRKWGITRLAARVFDLRGEGHKISGELVKRNGARVSSYRLEGRA